MDVAEIQLWPLALYFGVTVAITGAMLGVSYVLGQRHRESETGKPYESGIVSTGSARVRFDVKFYQNAIFFVVFDLEAMFIIAWAISIRESGWSGYGEIVIFIAVLGAALAYLWRQGALDWGPQRRRLVAGGAGGAAGGAGGIAGGAGRPAAGEMAEKSGAGTMESAAASGPAGTTPDPDVRPEGTAR